MRSKLPMIGGSSATFKSSLLVLCGPYTKRLLCRFGLYSGGIKIVSCSDIINAEYLSIATGSYSYSYS